MGNWCSSRAKRRFISFEDGGRFYNEDEGDHHDDGWPRGEAGLQALYAAYFKEREGNGIHEDAEGDVRRKKTQAEVHCAYLLSVIREVVEGTRASRTDRQDLASDDVVIRILDVGCGAGKITIDIARLFPSARVVGLDLSSAVLESARVYAEARGVGNVEFVQGSVVDLLAAGEGRKEEWEGRFDVVCTHQVVAHLAEPVRAIGEMRTVVRRGGVICLREGELGSGRFWPRGEYEDLKECFDVVIKVHEGNGGWADAGRRLRGWLVESGIEDEDIMATRGITCYDTPDERSEYGGHWPGRCLQGAFARKAAVLGVDDAKLEGWAQAWKSWIEDDEAKFIMMHGEVVARVT